MNFQLVLQFPAEAMSDFDRLIEIEDVLTADLGDAHLVDGHDFASGEMNIFILTDDPRGAFLRAKESIRPAELANLKAAYRPLSSEVYTIVWPADWKGPFRVL